MFGTRHLAFSVMLLTAAGLLAACTPVSDTAPPPQSEALEAPPVTSAPAFVPGGSAEENLPYFTQTLEHFALGDQPVEGQPVVNAVADAGFDKSDMQVSFDRSETNLVADNIFVSVRVAEDCLIGQVVVSDRSVVTLVDAALGPEHNICLIGETRVIDW